MPRVSKPARDLSQLSGKSLGETLESSTLDIGAGTWLTSPDLAERRLSYTPEVISNMTVFLLANPNMSSSHLFRADILFDSLGLLETPQEKEKSFSGRQQPQQERREREDKHVSQQCSAAGEQADAGVALPPKPVAGFELVRTVVRRLIPRNPKLDRPLEQTCHFYESDGAVSGQRACNDSRERCGHMDHKRLLVVYTPHVSKDEDVPWYHPRVRGLAFLYSYAYSRLTAADMADDALEKVDGAGTLSLHFLPFESPQLVIANRLERTLFALLNVHVRLARGSSSLAVAQDGTRQNPAKDNIIPQHLIQNTYSRLKLTYAAELCEKWVEETEPKKHVFEDLAITAFLIELWRSMYGVAPAKEDTEAAARPVSDTSAAVDGVFPGFVDVACGNGVLVYVLLMEGYRGWGFDARRRKSWKIFPDWVQQCLREAIMIPQPFADALADSSRGQEALLGLGVETHNGVFPRDTFVISNHADELTVWTPLLAVLSDPESPLPFLAIPCCSHSLSGARYRYPASHKLAPTTSSTSSAPALADHSRGGKTQSPAREHPDQAPATQSTAAVAAASQDEDDQPTQQPAAGDLKALRAERQRAQTDGGFASSMYGSLTLKTMLIAQELGYEVEKTLLRIPSTRNIGLVGGRKKQLQARQRRGNGGDAWQASTGPALPGLGTALDGSEHRTHGAAGGNQEFVYAVVQRECSREGGVEAAAKIWVDRARGLHNGPGKGNVPKDPHNQEDAVAVE